MDLKSDRSRRHSAPFARGLAHRSSVLLTAGHWEWLLAPGIRTLRVLPDGTRQNIAKRKPCNPSSRGMATLVPLLSTCHGAQDLITAGIPPLTGARVPTPKKEG